MEKEEETTRELLLPNWQGSGSHGLTIAQRDDGVFVQEVTQNSPAARTGVVKEGESPGYGLGAGGWGVGGGVGGKGREQAEVGEWLPRACSQWHQDGRYPSPALSWPLCVCHLWSSGEAVVWGSGHLVLRSDSTTH